MGENNTPTALKDCGVKPKYIKAVTFLEAGAILGQFQLKTHELFFQVGILLRTLSLSLYLGKIEFETMSKLQTEFEFFLKYKALDL